MNYYNEYNFYCFDGCCNLKGLNTLQFYHKWSQECLNPLMNNDLVPRQLVNDLSSTGERFHKNMWSTYQKLMSLTPNTVIPVSTEEAELFKNYTTLLDSFHHAIIRAFRIYYNPNKRYLRKGLYIHEQVLYSAEGELIKATYAAGALMAPNFIIVALAFAIIIKPKQTQFH